MRHLLTIGQSLERFVTKLGELSAWLIMALMGVILFDVILRNFFVVGSVKLQELEWHLHGSLFLLGLGFAYIKGAHVRIEIIWDRCSARTRAMIEIVGILVFALPYCFAIYWFGSDFAEMAFDNNEVSASQTGLSMRWVIKTILVAGFLLFALACLSVLLKALAFLAGVSGAERLPVALDEPQEGS